MKPVIKKCALRGGGWLGRGPAGLRGADRYWLAPSWWNMTIGLRPALDVPKEEKR